MLAALEGIFSCYRSGIFKNEGGMSSQYKLSSIVLMEKCVINNEADQSLNIVPVLQGSWEPDGREHLCGWEGAATEP